MANTTFKSSYNLKSLKEITNRIKPEVMYERYRLIMKLLKEREIKYGEG